jgi:hypothetical protein
VTIISAGRDIGLHGALNGLFDHIQPREEDVVIGFDCDEVPQTTDWAQAMIKVHAADPRIGWISLTPPIVLKQITDAGIPLRNIGGVGVYTPPHPLMAAVSSFSGRAWRAVRPWNEPCKYYGGLEMEMAPRFYAAGYQLAWLSSHTVHADRSKIDPEYQAWKMAHVGFEPPQFHGSFAEWLAAGGSSARKQ